MSIEQQQNGSVAIYHCVSKRETFETTAQILFKLVRAAEDKFPGAARLLYLDIEGHRNKKGGFDQDMYELQERFLVEYLSPFLTEIHAPLIQAKCKNTQRNDVPEQLLIAQDGGQQ